MTTQEDLHNAADILRRGGVIAYPTDTVWGIGCDAANAQAVSRVYEIKRRSDAKALITLVADRAMLCRTVDDIPEAALQIIDAAVAPVTIVYDSPCGLAPNLLAADGSAGVRVTSEPFSRELCRMLGRAVVSTSANFSGEPSPAGFDDISPELLRAVDYVCAAGRTSAGPGKPSSVIKIDSHSRITILRK